MQFIYLCLLCRGALSQEGPPGTQLTWSCFRLLAKTRLLSLCISRPQKFEARFHRYIWLARRCWILCSFFPFVWYTNFLRIFHQWCILFITDRKFLRHELLSAREEMWQERERALRDLYLSHLKNNTFLCHCYKQYCSECISPASSWGLWMISRKQCCVYESSRRHTSQWWQGGRHLAGASGVIWCRTGAGTPQPKWNYSWPTTRSSVSHALPRPKSRR